MRDNDTKILIVQPKPDPYFLTPVSPPSNHYPHPSQTELHRAKIRKQRSHQINMSSQSEVCLRECCKRKDEIYKQSIIEAISKRNYLMGNDKHSRQSHNALKYHQSTKNDRPRNFKKRTLTYQGEIRSRNKIYFLHNLKQFELQDIEEQQTDINERQAKHKTAHTHNRTKLIQWKEHFSKDQISLNNYKDKQKQTQKLKVHKNKQSAYSPKVNESYSNQVTSRVNPKQVSKQSRQKEEAKTDPTRKYYKYLQNYQNIGQNQSPPAKKAMNAQQDEQKSVQSYFKPQSRKDSSTIFHTNKLKLNSSLKQSRVKSSKILSKGYLFRIPHTQDEQTNFLLNYQSLNPDFDIKSIVQKQNFNILLRDQKIYFGLVKDEKKHGSGLLISHKELFEGQFRQDLKFNGIQKTSQGVYVGTYVHGLREGQGKYTWINGQEFEGEWKKGKKNGHGIWKSPKGNYYEGEWQNNKQNGKGIFTHVGGSKYSGYFKDFLKHGRGQEQFANGDKYNGQYKYGKPHGFGRYIWANGDTYDGQFVQGQREGQGTLTKKNGESYQGCFVNDMKQGEGKQRFATGQYFQGWFQKDEKIRGKFFNKKGVLLQQLK